MSRALIDRYESDASVPARAIAGLSRAQLNQWPIPGAAGEWSIQQIIVHLMDSDLIGAARMKQIIAEDEPLIAAYDETLFSRNLHYEKFDASLVCEVFRINRLLMATLLRQLPDAAFERTGNHTERGRITLASLVQSHVNHVEHHMKFLREKRELLKAPA